ncbi:MAG: RdgB/HAM1 family non-canonical purine NTP pyrophosphatase [Eubacteriales bacterium]|nr:RdgB/HAM1 family non-canonical purine NTP pyrophosphatase [Eubacteriales bacterium]
MEQQIIFATGNQGKLKEIRMLLSDFALPVISMKDAGIVLDIEENGTTFLENAVIKAKAVHEAALSAIVLADDSGLVIDALNGEPGIYSARYLGEDTSYDYKNAQLIGRLDGVEDEKRSARFVCAVAAVLPDGRVLSAEDTMEGRIAYEPAGGNGFGYDPIFWLPEYGCTSAEISPELKNELSHRGKALRAMKAKLKKELLEG